MAKGARRVVTGYDDKGNCIWVSDGESKAFVGGDGETQARVTDLWRISRTPVPMDEDGNTTEYAIMPPDDGLVFRHAMIPPMSATRVAPPGQRPITMHETETIDLMTMISGEIWSELEGNGKQICLKAGDVFIMRGTNHAWYNKSDKPAVFTVTLVAAKRTKKTPPTKLKGSSVYRRGEPPRPH